MLTATHIDEAEPTTWPTVSGLSTAAEALDEGALWSRIEEWIAWRFTERAVTWQVTGPGEWSPSLRPAVIDSAERWVALTEWAAVELSPAPRGYTFEEAGRYRIRATVGADSEAPPAVLSAYRRLAEHLAAEASLVQVPGGSNVAAEIGGGGSELRLEYRRNPAAISRALANSGAADLLRPYRRP